MSKKIEKPPIQSDAIYKPDYSNAFNIYKQKQADEKPSVVFVQKDDNIDKALKLTSNIAYPLGSGYAIGTTVDNVGRYIKMKRAGITGDVKNYRAWPFGKSNYDVLKEAQSAYAPEMKYKPFIDKVKSELQKSGAIKNVEGKIGTPEIKKWIEIQKNIVPKSGIKTAATEAAQVAKPIVTPNATGNIIKNMGKLSGRTLGITGALSILPDIYTMIEESNIKSKIDKGIATKEEYEKYKRSQFEKELFEYKWKIPSSKKEKRID